MGGFVKFPQNLITQLTTTQTKKSSTRNPAYGVGFKLVIYRYELKIMRDIEGRLGKKTKTKVVLS
jgi:hypothetical protein